MIFRTSKVKYSSFHTEEIYRKCIADSTTASDLNSVKDVAQTWLSTEDSALVFLRDW